jgi:transcriptional regulator GlxA family with amidase domain
MDETKRTVGGPAASILSDQSDPRVVVVVDFFRRNLSRRIKIDELSAFVRLSPSGLRRLFRQQVGCSIGKWQKEERMQTARILLCTSYLSVKEIAAAVGQQDVSHFVRDFELAVGLSPTRYRKANFDAAQL